ncbi:MAG TPA: DUF3854 domain-containing protein [Pirellulales bacterium]|jgi:putative DNA primase/helicase
MDHTEFDPLWEEYPTQFLLPEHLDDLKRSGLSAETIAACMFRSETDSEVLRRILGRNRADVPAPGLVIPFRQLNGKFNGFARVRPSRPRLIDGKPVKYEQPINTAARVYIPPLTVAALRNPDIPIGISEGEKKSAAADQAGFPCLGLIGVWNWQVAKSNPRHLIPDLAGVVWRRRKVWIGFDTDPRINFSVMQARAELACALDGLGAVVSLVDLPPGPRDSTGAHTKNAIDDFLRDHGPDAFHQLLCVHGAL